MRINSENQHGNDGAMPHMNSINAAVGHKRAVDASGVGRLLDKRNQLIESFMNGENGRFTDHNATILDEYFRESYEESQVGPSMGIMKNPYAVVALGGYGRREQCLFSDIDILFLFKNHVPMEAEALIQEMIYPLWDAGFEVGHATRSVKECVRMAGEDIEVLMSILDGRFICGMSSLFVQTMEQLRRKVIRSRAGKITSLVVDDITMRHQRFGDASYLLEPNLKEGRGGLRDYHTMLWIARIRSDLRVAKDLEYLGYVSEKDFEALALAVSFLHQVRNRLHFLTHRKCDQLYMEYQQDIARTMEFDDLKGKAPVELFLGELHGHMAVIKEQHRLFLSELGFLSQGKKGRRIIGQRSQVSGIFVNKRHMLDFVSIESILKNPLLLIRIFEESLHLKLPICAQAKRVIKELGNLITNDLVSRRESVNIVETILSTHSHQDTVLDEMMQTVILTRFVPEIKGIRNVIQYNTYHMYPVDKHSLKTVETAKKLGNKESEDALYTELYQELDDKCQLLWACLLHDIGKGIPATPHAKVGAELTRTILSRLKYDASYVETVAFLVKEHLYLVKTATRRDIHDEETVIAVARHIKDVQRLKMLYLLTVADCMATGEKAWNEWIASLVRDLFLKALKILKKGELATPEATEIVSRKKDELLSRSMGEEAVEECLSIMTPRYLLYVDTPAITKHIALYRELENQPFVFHVEKDPLSNTRIVTICAKNRPGLFAMLSGGFTLNSLDILGAQAFTWRNGVAIDIFRVTPPADIIFEDKSWQRIKGNFQEIIAGTIDLPQQLNDKIVKIQSRQSCPETRPIRVSVDNGSSSFFTIIEVVCDDFPGLLFSIAGVLFTHGLDIHMAKIATQIDQVADIFYVRNRDGEKLASEAETGKIAADIKTVLETQLGK